MKVEGEENQKEQDKKSHVFLKKYLILKEAHFFRLSNKDLQVVFVDKSEVFIE